MLSAIAEGIAKILQHIWSALFTIDDIVTSEFTKKQAETITNYWSDLIREHIIKISNSLQVPDSMEPELKTEINGLLADGSIGALVTALYYLVPWTMGYVYNTWAITQKDATRQVAATYTPALPDINHLIQLLWRDPNKEADINQMFRWLGFDEIQQANIMQAVKPLIGINELMIMLHRNEIGRAEYDKKMKQWGFEQDEIDKLHNIGWYIPSVPDLVRMAVREVFTPEVVDRFGQMQGFPSELAIHAKKQGLSEEWAKNYWAAHWELPSLQMGYEMLHRGEIEPQDLDMLMRAQDVMPFWRDKLKAISYKPYTRVDIRRMHALKVLFDEDLKKAYKDLGYDDEKAENMAKFTIKYNEAGEKDLTKGEILDSLKKGILEEQDVKPMLQNMGYDDREVKTLMDRALYVKEQEEKEATLAYVKAMYMHGVIYETDLDTEFGRLNLKASEATRIKDLWNKQKRVKLRKLTPKELLALLQAKHIELWEWKAKMKALHYSEEDVDLLEKLYVVADEAPEIRDLSLSHIKELYLKYIYEESDIEPLLKNLKISDDKVRDLMDLWKLLREEAAERKAKALTREDEAKVKELSSENIRKLFMADIYDASEATKHLQALKIADTEIFDLIELWKYDKAEKAKKEALAAEKAEKARLEKIEREKIAAEKAAIIAEEKRVRELGIADIKKLFLAGIYTVDKAKDHLRLLKIAEPEINDLIQLWEMGKST